MVSVVIVVVLLAVGAGGWSAAVVSAAGAPTWACVAMWVGMSWMTFLVCLLRVALHQAASRERQADD